jgi:hypothetical protein
VFRLKINHAEDSLAKCTWKAVSEAWGLDFTERYIIGIKMARFDGTKSLEDFRITLERVAMAAKWAADQKKEWEERGQLPASSP